MTKDEYIVLISKSSKTPQNEKILEMLNHYNVFGIRDLSLNQIKEFYEKEVFENEIQ